MSSRTKTYVQVALWLTRDQRDRLAAGQQRTKLTKQVLLRQAVEHLLRKHEGEAK